MSSTARRAPVGGSPNRSVKSGSEPGKHKMSPEAYDRGRKLQALLEVNNYPSADFARDAGISHPSIWMYLNGELDIAKMQQATVEKFLGTLAIPDTWAWDYFAIPPNVQDKWRTFRPPPLGHGEERRRLLDIILDVPLQGEMTVPVGYSITVDRDVANIGLIVTRLSDRLLVTPAEHLSGRGEILGQLIRVDTAARRG